MTRKRTAALPGRKIGLARTVAAAARARRSVDAGSRRRAPTRLCRAGPRDLEPWPSFSRISGFGFRVENRAREIRDSRTGAAFQPFIRFRGKPAGSIKSSHDNIHVTKRNDNAVVGVRGRRRDGLGRWTFRPVFTNVNVDFEKIS